MAALSPWMWFVGLFLFALLTFTFPNPILILFLLLSAFDVYHRWKAYRSGDRSYYKVSTRARVLTVIVYLGLVVGLALAMDATHLERDFDDV